MTISALAVIVFFMFHIINRTENDMIMTVFLASMIMYKIDEGVIHSGITEQK